MPALARCISFGLAATLACVVLAGCSAAPTEYAGRVVDDTVTLQVPALSMPSVNLDAGFAQSACRGGTAAQHGCDGGRAHRHRQRLARDKRRGAGRRRASVQATRSLGSTPGRSTRTWRSPRPRWLRRARRSACSTTRSIPWRRTARRSRRSARRSTIRGGAARDHAGEARGPARGAEGAARQDRGAGRGGGRPPLPPGGTPRPARYHQPAVCRRARPLRAPCPIPRSCGRASPSSPRHSRRSTPGSLR